MLVHAARCVRCLGSVCLGLRFARLTSCCPLAPRFTGSFGAAYAAFMGTRAFAPHERPPVRFVNDAELAYVATRCARSLSSPRHASAAFPLLTAASRHSAREVHDLWHVLFGCDTTVMGELALKAVEALQTGLPSAGLAALVAPLRLSRQRRAAFAAVYLPWALRAGGKAADLMCIRYERHFTEPLQVRRTRWHDGGLRVAADTTPVACVHLGMRRTCGCGGGSSLRRHAQRRWRSRARAQREPSPHKHLLRRRVLSYRCCGCICTFPLRAR